MVYVTARQSAASKSVELRQVYHPNMSPQLPIRTEVGLDDIAFGRTVAVSSAIVQSAAAIRIIIVIRPLSRDAPNTAAVVQLQSREITQKWSMPPREWAAAKAQLAMVFGDRFEVNR
jgi:hypothetical protein